MTPYSSYRRSDRNISDLEKRTGNVVRLAQITEVEAENMYVVLELILDHLTSREYEHDLIQAQNELLLQRLNKIEALILERSKNDKGRNGTSSGKV